MACVSSLTDAFVFAVGWSLIIGLTLAIWIIVIFTLRALLKEGPKLWR